MKYGCVISLLFGFLMVSCGMHPVFADDQSDHVAYDNKSETSALKTVRRELDVYSISNWNDFDRSMKIQYEKDEQDGTAYLISGALLIVGGTVGYSNSSNSVEKLGFSISQSLGVAGLGYGAYLSFIGRDHSPFYESLSQSSLNSQQKDELVGIYMKKVRKNQDTEKWIRVASHASVAGINFYNASREEDRDLQAGLMVLGLVNALAAVSISF